jgi:hypothetical protein
MGLTPILPGHYTERMAPEPFRPMPLVRIPSRSTIPTGCSR